MYYANISKDKLASWIAMLISNKIAFETKSRVLSNIKRDIYKDNKR